MNDEEAFQRALDKNPEDHILRLIFADWLQERDDERAAGYRALGANQRCPRYDPTGALNPGDWAWVCGMLDRHNFMYWKSHPWRLPMDWSDFIGRRHVQSSRRVAEDVAALAFRRLPAKRRAKLLKQQEAEA